MYEGRLWTKCSTRRFVMAFHRFGTPRLLVELLFSEFDSAFYEVDSFCEVVSSSYQFDSSAGLFDSSLCEFDSSLTTSVRRRLSFCRFDSSTQKATIQLQLHQGFSIFPRFWFCACYSLKDGGVAGNFAERHK